jgi:hypothetical protein
MDSLNAIRNMNMGAPAGFIAPIRPLFSPFGGQVGTLDQVSLGNEVSDADFFAQLAQMKQSAMAARNGNFAAQNFGVQPIGSPFQAPTSDPNVDLFQAMRALKQQALQQAGKDNQGKDDGKGGKTGQAAGGRFSITARSLERDGKLVPVTNISIHEVGNWGGSPKGKARDVEPYWGSNDRYEQTNTFDHPTKPGAYYQATITWADGSTKTIDRQMPTSGDFSETVYQAW